MLFEDVPNSFGHPPHLHTPAVTYITGITCWYNNVIIPWSWSMWLRRACTTWYDEKIIKRVSSTRQRSICINDRQLSRSLPRDPIPVASRPLDKIHDTEAGAQVVFFIYIYPSVHAIHTTRLFALLNVYVYILLFTLFSFFFSFFFSLFFPIVPCSHEYTRDCPTIRVLFNFFLRTTTRPTVVPDTRRVKPYFFNVFLECLEKIFRVCVSSM